LRAIPVDHVVTNGDPDITPDYLDFEAAIVESGAEHTVVKKDDSLPFGSLTFEVLSPRKINPTSTNNNSIVLRLEVGKVTFLFTGDIQELEEMRLVNSRAPLRADILKIPHHAADTSSRPVFLETVKPDVAIYMAETGNIHGFPHQVTLENLTIVGAQIYGSDVNGTITVTTDGRNYGVQTERGEPLNNPD
jgi:beta-lactamase superfamily II metal-dependent hydrolase